MFDVYGIQPPGRKVLLVSTNDLTNLIAIDEASLSTALLRESSLTYGDSPRKAV